MLYTNLKHIETAADYTKIISDTERVVIICGRMYANCISVFKIAEELRGLYKHVEFFDMEFDNPESIVLRNVIENYDLENVPLVVYFKNGNLVEATYGKQTKEQIAAVLNREYAYKIVC